MADFRDRLSDDLKAAMRGHDVTARETIRLLNAALKYAQIAAMRQLTEAEAVSTLVAQINQRRDSIEQFRRGGREDLASKEEAEMAILAAYLPPAPTQQEVADAVQEAITELGASSPADMGRVIRAVLDRYPGHIDGKVLAPVVRQALVAKA